MSVNCIQDLLAIIEKYPYCHSKEYNINVYALHQIKTELESIEKMIGMTINKAIGLVIKAKPLKIPKSGALESLKISEGISKNIGK